MIPLPLQSGGTSCFSGFFAFFCASRFLIVGYALILFCKACENHGRGKHDVTIVAAAKAGRFLFVSISVVFVLLHVCEL